MASALAIDGVIKQNYWSILWLITCHFTTLLLEVAAKLANTRAFMKVYTDLATHLTDQSYKRQVTLPSSLPAYPCRGSTLRFWSVMLLRYC
jgi:hypothetical protein